MKRKNIIAFSVALMAIGAFTSCSDEFLQDKKNYDYVDASTYNTFSGAKARVDDIYAWCLPNTSSEPSWKYNSTCLLYTSPSPRDMRRSRMPSSA